MLRRSLWYVQYLEDIEATTPSMVDWFQGTRTRLTLCRANRLIGGVQLNPPTRVHHGILATASTRKQAQCARCA